MRPNINIYQQEENLAVIVKVNGESLDIDKATTGQGIKKIVTKGKKKKTKPLRILKIAAACVLFLAITFKIAYNLSTPWEERVYNKYYEPLDKSSSVLLDGADFSEAKKKYQKGESEDAWLIIKNLDDDYSREKSLCLYKGLILMDMGKYKKAISYFDNLLGMQDNEDLKAQTKLYRGLCLLRIEDIKKAKKDFEEIGKADFEEYQKANKLLRKIEKHGSPLLHGSRFSL